MEPNQEIPTLTDVVETTGEATPLSLLGSALTEEQLAVLRVESDAVSQETLAEIQPVVETVAEVAALAGSEHADVRKAATAATLGTLFAESGEATSEPVSEAGAEGEKSSFWNSHPVMRKLALAGTAAVSLLMAPQMATAGGHGLRDQVRAELQLQAGTAVNNGLNGLIQIGVGVVANRVGVPAPQPVYGPQPGVVVGVGGYPPPPGVYQPGRYEAGSDIRNVRAGEVGNFEQALAAHQGLAAQYYGEMNSYYQRYQATGSKGDGDMYLQKRALYESEMGQVQAAQRNLEAARRNMVNGR